MVMCATVSCVEDNRLMVIDNKTRQEVAVNTCCLNFEQGDRIKIIYNGAMTMSIPPQISASRIIRLNCK